jgi:hypothetical protein
VRSDCIQPQPHTQNDKGCNEDTARYVLLIGACEFQRDPPAKPLFKAPQSIVISVTNNLGRSRGFDLASVARYSVIHTLVAAKDLAPTPLSRQDFGLPHVSTWICGAPAPGYPGRTQSSTCIGARFAYAWIEHHAIINVGEDCLDNTAGGSLVRLFRTINR